MRYLEDAIASGVRTPDEADGRVYGWIPGVVTDIDTKLMRVKARIGKQEDGDSTDWLVPIGMGSIESLPEINDPIGVIFADGDPHRGAYFYFPQSTTKSRPTSEPVPLGLTFAGMHNNHAQLLNKIVADLATLSTLLSTGLAVSGTKATGTFTPTATGTMGNIKTSDGAVVAPKSGDNIALSKRPKVR